MKQTRRQFAATLFASGVLLFLPKTFKPSGWKKRNIINVDMSDGVQGLIPEGAVSIRHDGIGKDGFPINSRLMVMRKGQWTCLVSASFVIKR